MKRKLGLALAILTVASGSAFASEGNPCAGSQQQTSTQNADQQQKAKKHKKEKKREPQQQQDSGAFSIYG
jgi:ribosomal protein L12E/L44/L45/RPP1/RPP2